MRIQSRFARAKTRDQRSQPYQDDDGKDPERDESSLELVWIKRQKSSGSKEEDTTGLMDHGAPRDVR
jgi:hypothetical protein